ncbi:hypothetical protein DFH09DRAFT_1381453 [Mycena vulgaris]|nr:hypothetical protein DFH09DRAFT_1381453 [Mycena vulgaris]
MSTAIPIPPNIESIVGSQLIGSLLNFCLYGVLAVQVVVYRLSFPNDTPSIKWLVYTVFFLETIMTAMNGADVYYWFASGFGDVLRLAGPALSAFYTPIMGSIMAFIVQVFFSYRIYIIQRRAIWFCVAIAFLSLLQVVGGIGGGISSYVSQNVVHDPKRTGFVYLWLIGDALADILIAGTMTFLLTTAKLPEQNYSQTNDIVRRIVRLVIETNTVSTVVAVLSLLLFAGAPNTTYFICPTMVLAKLYSNTLLVTFNNRTFVRNAARLNGSAPYSSSIQASAKSQSRPFSAGLGLNTSTEPMSVTYDAAGVRPTSTVLHDAGDPESHDLDMLLPAFALPCASWDPDGIHFSCGVKCEAELMDDDTQTASQAGSPPPYRCGLDVDSIKPWDSLEVFWVTIFAFCASPNLGGVKLRLLVFAARLSRKMFTMTRPAPPSLAGRAPCSETRLLVVHASPGLEGFSQLVFGTTAALAVSAVLHRRRTTISVCSARSAVVVFMCSALVNIAVFATTM